MRLGFDRLPVSASGEWWQNYGVSGRVNSDSATPVDNGSGAWLATVGGSYDFTYSTLGLEYAHGALQTAKSTTDLHNAVSLQATYDVDPGPDWKAGLLFI